jgi:hypothetical protein
MSQETKRKCGFRKVEGLYLCGEYIAVPCDRLPYPLEVCPVCGAGIKVSRGFTKIIPLRLFGYHQPCNDQVRPCYMCDPTEDMAFIMGVGEKYYKTPEDFIEEGYQLGISKRIPFIPKELELGKTVIYLSHPKACVSREPAYMQQAMAILEETKNKQPKLFETEKVEKKQGIFAAFIPQRVEMLVWEHDASPEKLAELEKRGITPVVINDGDMDHAKV